MLLTRGASADADDLDHVDAYKYLPRRRPTAARRRRRGADEKKAAPDGVLTGRRMLPESYVLGGGGLSGERPCGGAGTSERCYADDAVHASDAPALAVGSGPLGRSLPVAFDCGLYHSAFATASGEVRSCGQDGDGQVGAAQAVAGVSSRWCFVRPSWSRSRRTAW